jgi:hypothetical protein
VYSVTSRKKPNWAVQEYTSEEVSPQESNNREGERERGKSTGRASRAIVSSAGFGGILIAGHGFLARLFTRANSGVIK